jgi:hypothetical protein
LSQLITHREGGLQGPQREYWLHLCELAANEQDAEKLMELVKEINRLLEEKELRLKKKSPRPRPRQS